MIRNYYLKLFAKISLILLVIVNFAALLVLSYVYFNGLNKWWIISHIPSDLRHIGKSIINLVIESPYLKYHFFNNNLPVYELYVKNGKLKDINDHLIDLATGDYIKMLTQDAQIKVSAKMFFDGKEYDVKAGYRGRQADHWLWPKKSWDINFKKSSPQVGEGGFELIVPSTRGFIAEAFNFFRAKKFGLVVPKYEFVWLKLNGKDMGVYFKTDSLDKNFLNDNLLDAEAPLYREGDYLEPLFLTFDKSFPYWRQKNYSSSDESMENFASLSLLLDTINAEEDKYDKNIWNLMDRENFVNWAVFTTLAGSTHQDWLHDIRLYFDKKSGKFQLLPFNVEVWPWISNEALFVDYNPLVTRAIANQEFLLDFEKKMWSYVDNENNLNDDLREYDRIVFEVKNGLIQDIYDTFSSKQVIGFLTNTREVIKQNFRTIKNILDSVDANMIISVNPEDPNMSLFLKVHHKIKSNSIVEFTGIDLSGLSYIPYYSLDIFKDKNSNGNYDNGDERIGRLIYDEKTKKYSLQFKDAIYPNFSLPDRSEEAFKNQFSPNTPMPPLYQDYVLFIKTNIPASTSIKDLKIESNFTNLITGTKIKEKEIHYLDFRTIPGITVLESASLTPQQFVSRFVGFSLGAAGEIVFSGEQNFNNSLIIPRGTKLMITSGSKMIFSDNVAFISYSPIEAIGTSGEPIDIYFGKRGGLIIIDTYKDKNLFEYVNFYQGGDGMVNGLELKGSVVFIRSDSLIKHCSFNLSNASDALNIRFSSSTILNNIFKDNNFDAVDFDGGNGIIEENTFLDNKEDAIDLDSATVQTSDNFVRTN